MIGFDSSGPLAGDCWQNRRPTPLIPANSPPAARCSRLTGGVPYVSSAYLDAPDIFERDGRRSQRRKAFSLSSQPIHSHTKHIGFDLETTNQLVTAASRKPWPAGQIRPADLIQLARVGMLSTLIFLVMSTK